jgi:hypothetical protein
LVRKIRDGKFEEQGMVLLIPIQVQGAPVVVVGARCALWVQCWICPDDALPQFLAPLINPAPKIDARARKIKERPSRQERRDEVHKIQG